MANAGGQEYSNGGKNNSERFSGKDQSRNYKSPEMILNLGSKSEAFVSDQTPTPIRLIQKCEEMGLFQDLQSVNPFEETFRKAAEDIRSGTTSLVEVSSLSVPSNSDDSLHTPHVIFPPVGDLSKIKRAISPRDDLSISAIQHDTDPLCIHLDTDETSKTVVQQEADTSEQTQIPDINISTHPDESSFGTIQFLLRMPNGKMVQLSSLPVEQMDATPTGSKDIPIIKVDSSFLKTIKDGSSKETPTLSTTVIAPSNNMIDTNTYSSTSNVVSSDDETVVSRVQSISVNRCNLNSMKTVDNRNASEQFSKMALAKLKLKQALMNNACPAANLSSSSNSISSGSTSSTIVASSTSHSQPEFVTVRRPSSTSDDGVSRDDISRDDPNHDVSSVEEKRRRNRAAAMRCREKRKTWVKELERRANDMLRTNGQLQYEVSLLRDEVAQLKTLLLAHRDCPVTQALVQAKAALPDGTKHATAISNTSSQTSKRSSNKDQKTSQSTAVIQTGASANPVKPLILLNNPPVKRKRLNSSTNSSSTVCSSATAVSVGTSSPSTSSSVHTLVLPSKNSTVLNSSFVNVIPSVLVANPTTSTCNSLSGPSQLIYSQLLPCLPSLTPNSNLIMQRQPYILPKSSANILTPDKSTVLKQTKSEAKFRRTHMLSTNVIKVNPNIVERDNDDSDIEILDVKPSRS